MGISVKALCENRATPKPLSESSKLAEHVKRCFKLRFIVSGLANLRLAALRKLLGVRAQGMTISNAERIICNITPDVVEQLSVNALGSGDMLFLRDRSLNTIGRATDFLSYGDFHMLAHALVDQGYGNLPALEGGYSFVVGKSVREAATDPCPRWDEMIRYVNALLHIT